MVQLLLSVHSWVRFNTWSACPDFGQVFGVKSEDRGGGSGVVGGWGVGGGGGGGGGKEKYRRKIQFYRRGKIHVLKIPYIKNPMY